MKHLHHVLLTVSLVSCGGGPVSTLDGHLGFELPDGRSFDYDGPWHLDKDQDEKVNRNTGLISFTGTGTGLANGPVNTRYFLAEDPGPFEMLGVQFVLGMDPYVYPGPNGTLQVFSDPEFAAESLVPMLTEDIIYTDRQFRIGVSIEGDATLGDDPYTFDVSYDFDLVTGSDCDSDGKRLTSPDGICDFANGDPPPVFPGPLSLEDGEVACPDGIYEAMGMSDGGACEFDQNDGSYTIGGERVSCSRGVAFGYTCYEHEVIEAEGCSWEVDLIVHSAPKGKLMAKPDEGCAASACYAYFECCDPLDPLCS